MADETPIYDPFLTGRGGPAPTPQGSTAPAGPAETSGMATWSVVLGVLGFTCLPAVGGLLALTLGIAAKGEINRSEGRKKGSGLALTGALLGAANLVVSIAGFALLMVLSGTSSKSASTPASPPYVAPAPVPTFGPAPTPSGPTPSTTPGTRTSSREPGVTLTKIGKIDLVDIDPDVTSLARELDKQRAEAKKDDKTLLLWVVVKDCLPCNGVAAALPDTRMQTALERARVVRVDGRELGPELTYLGIPTGKVPGFALLGSSNRPVDYVNGGEWDEDIPRNIAPVLGKFVARRYAQRREQWRGTRRDDETTL